MKTTSTHRHDALTRRLDAAVTDRVTPGLVAVIGSITAPKRRWTYATGRLRYEPDAPPVELRTHYDLASLTKILSTAVVTAWAEAQGLLALSDTPWGSWPGVSIADVLQHRAGLPAWSPLYQEGAGVPTATPAKRASILDAARQTAPLSSPGTATLYSDIGFIALGAWLEDRLGAPLDVLWRCASAETFGDSGLRYVDIPHEGYHPQYPSVAPTEECPWRGRVVQGQVHDDNAFAMGGVAGHAGLFGSALDVERAAQYFLNAVNGPRDAVSSRLRMFALSSGERGLGFDRATAEGTTGGALGPSAFGHLGFTGTSLWMDPDHGGLYYILLTNRVHPRRDGEGIRQLRIDFHRLAAHALRG